MGTAMGMPIKTLIAELFSDPVKLLKTITTYWFVKILYWNRRLDVFNLWNPKSLGDIGFAVTDQEMNLETPDSYIPQHSVDSVLMFGSNSLGDILVARICREEEGQVSWLLLQMSDGYVYQLPNTEKGFPPSSEFTAGGLRIRCNIPMRQWRISFNGFLRQIKTDEIDVIRTVHVKFSFLCISTGFPFDVYHDIHPSVLAKYLVQDNSSDWFQNPKKYYQIFKSHVCQCYKQKLIYRVTKLLNRYVQPVSIIGTVTVDGNNEREMYLLGAKLRARDSRTCQHKTPLKFREVLGYTKDGQLIYTGMFKPPGFKTNLHYGHYMERCGLSWPVMTCKQTAHFDDINVNRMEIDIQTSRSSVTVEVISPSFSQYFPSGVSRGHRSHVFFSEIRTQDGDTGKALILDHQWSQLSQDRLPGPEWKIERNVESSLAEPKLLVPLYDPSCQDSSQTGGKGSSLAALSYLADKYQTNFQVPEGFVVTTSGYKEFFKKSGIEDQVNQFEKMALLVNQVSKAKLPASIEGAIRRQMMQQFSEPEQKRFAVRSSAAGEDSEELSAAGQMSTLLGIQGIDNILKAVVKCWASQFSFTAIEYKRQNGQSLNSLMAVVVQEMVPADLAGVLFTCDPVTGNPGNITITGNFGIGESVVSASAEPDTVVLQRDDKNQLEIKTVQIGKKRTVIVMSDDGVVEEKSIMENSNVCCISPEKSLLLAEASLKVEEAYGFPVDVEWAFKDNNLFMLQARPVTTFDKETKFELAHAIDNGLRAEEEYNTRANIGEVMPGACSYLGLSFFVRINGHMFSDLYKHRNPYGFPFNPYQVPLIASQNHGFHSLANLVLRFYRKGEPSFLSEASVLAGFGRLLEEEDIYDQADKRRKSYPSTFFPYQLIFFINDLILTNRRTRKSTERLWKEKMALKSCKNSREMYYEIMKRSADCLYGAQSHLDNTLNASIYTGLTMSILASANKGWNTTVFSDLAIILSSCGNIESADVPFWIELLLEAIQKEIDVRTFKEMTAEEALEWLETTHGSTATMFKDFIKKHGHRGFKELDVHSKPWRMNKIPLVQVLQESISKVQNSEKNKLSTSDILQQLKSPLSWCQRLVLKVLIPLCQKSVGNRECGKSLFVKFFDFARNGFWTLAEKMENEGRLPDKDLLFFLSEFEILQLIETRSPLLLQKAVRRKKFYPELELLRFPEITKGVPKPVNSPNRENLGSLAADLEIKGVPVSQGVVKGTARVATNLNEAADLQKGEILIACSTDIAWSAYFPLLSGVATELGGLISHGAVVAREYGLPCVVGVFEATNLFKTGDTVLLDGNQGILKRIKEQ